MKSIEYFFVILTATLVSISIIYSVNTTTNILIERFNLEYSKTAGMLLLKYISDLQSLKSVYNVINASYTISLDRKIRIDCINESLIINGINISKIENLTNCNLYTDIIEIHYYYASGKEFIKLTEK